MELIKWFKDIDKSCISVAGGKGANLGEMYNAHFPIPPGFIITAQAYEYFIERTGIKNKILDIIRNINVEDTPLLQNISENIQNLIKSAPVPDDIKEAIIENYSLLGIENKSQVSTIMKGTEEFVAVRSSATAEDLPEASFAGQQATFLNVRGKQNIVAAVRECWASLFTARAVYYRAKNNFPTEKVLIAVVVQRMVNSDKAGVMFTVNPATNDESEIVIEAAQGLGETVVSGSVSPDLYILNKNGLDIKHMEIKLQKFKIIRDPATGNNIEKKIPADEDRFQVLTDNEAQALARYGRRIHEYYGNPQDIEWAIEGNNLYIVQTRAVTTLKKKAKSESKESDGKEHESKDTDGKESGSKGYDNIGYKGKESDGKEHEINYEETLKVSNQNVLVRGEVACAGIAFGPVKVIIDMSNLNKVQKGDIMVTTMTNPDMVPAMQKAAGIVTDEGGMTSHAAIVSREMGTPCIVGTEVATQVLKDYQIITVDATSGVVYEGKTITIEHKKEEKSVVVSEHDDITGTSVKVIMDFPDRAEEVSKATNADGVGLLRLEFIIASGGVHPAQYVRENRDEDYIGLLMKEVRKVSAAFKDKPVWVRCSDLRTDEYRNLNGGDREPHETDPMIGWHAIRRLLDEPRILKAEYTAIMRLHKEGHKNLGIMLPFVINVEEVKKAKEYLKEVGMEPGKDVKFGVMIETPASCWIINDICKEGIDFVSFGTNDLTQLTLGIDRNNQHIQKQFDEMHPAVLGELSMVIKTCRKYGVETSICGQAASRPEMAEFLVRHGIDSVSPNPDAVHLIRHMIARTERKILLEAERMRGG